MKNFHIRWKDKCILKQVLNKFSCNADELYITDETVEELPENSPKGIIFRQYEITNPNQSQFGWVQYISYYDDQVKNTYFKIKMIVNDEKIDIFDGYGYEFSENLQNFVNNNLDVDTKWIVDPL